MKYLNDRMDEKEEYKIQHFKDEKKTSMNFNFLYLLDNKIVFFSNALT